MAQNDIEIEHNYYYCSITYFPTVDANLTEI